MFGGQRNGFWSKLAKFIGHMGRVQKTPIAVLVLIGISLFALTQNCSQPVNLDLIKYEDQPGAMQATVTINNGSGMTNDSNVNLKFEMIHAREVLISRGGEDCVSEGTWLPIDQASSYVLDPLEETKTLFVNFRNFNKREISCASASVTLDTTAPQVLLSEAPANISNEKNPMIVFKGSDNLVGIDRFECRLNSGNFAQCSEEVSHQNMQDGPYRFEMQAYDKAGNKSNLLVYEWLIDTIAPSINFGAKPAAYSQLLSTNLEFTVLDGNGSQIKSIKCQVDGGAEAACTSPLSLTGLSQGSHTVKILTEDKAGNEIFRTYSWVVDSIDPTLTILSRPAAIGKFANVEFKFEAKDSDGAGSGIQRFECGLDTGTDVACTSPRKLSVANGPHKFRVVAIDRAGNEVTHEIPFFVDTVAPIFGPVTEPTRYIKTLSAQFVMAPADPGGANASGIQVMECAKDVGAFAICPASKTFSGLVNGQTYAFHYRLLDKAGNLATKNYTVTVDRSLPLKPTINIKPTNPTALKSGKFTFSSTDNTGGSGLAGYVCILDSGEEKACNGGSFYFAGLEPKWHTFKVIAVDKAGNRSAAATYGWTVTQ